MFLSLQQKRLISLMAFGMNYQFEPLPASFFEAAPSRETIASEKLESRKNVHPVEALKTLPGLVLNGSEVTTYTSSVFLRGASSDHTLFLWNDLHADDFTAPAGAVDPFGIATEFSNQVQVLKGPQSLLYGSQALGGVVLIDDDRNLDSQLTLANGSLNTQKGVLELRENFGDERKTFLAAGVSGLSTEGVSAYNAAVPHGRAGELERDGNSKSSVTVIFTKELPERSEFQALWNQSQARASDDSPPDDDVNAVTTRKGSQWKLRYQKDWQAQFKSRFLLTGQNTERESSNPADAFSPSESYDQSRGQRLRFQNQNSWRSDQCLWHFGFESVTEQGHFRSTSSFQPTWSEFSPARQEQSLFAVNDWNFSKADLSWGLRGTCENGAACASVYQLSAQWHWPEQQQSIYAIISSGLKLPTLYQVYSSSGHLGLQAEQSTAYEIGFLQHWGTADKVKLSLFNNDFSQLIDYDFVTSKYQNINKARTTGVEFLHQKNFGKWETEFSLARLQAVDQTSGLPLLRRPELQAAGTLGWSFQSSLKLQLESLFRGERDDISALGKRLKLPSIVLWNTTLVYKFVREQELFFRVNNLSNSFYEDISGYQTPGRFYWAGFKFSF